MSDFATSRRVVARKGHKCIECGAKIQPGMRYVRMSGVGDGSPWSVVYCEPCHALAVEVWAMLDGDNLNPGDWPRWGELIVWLTDSEDYERLSPEGFARYWSLSEEARIRRGHGYGVPAEGSTHG